MTAIATCRQLGIFHGFDQIFHPNRIQVELGWTKLPCRNGKYVGFLSRSTFTTLYPLNDVRIGRTVVNTRNPFLRTVLDSGLKLDSLTWEKHSCVPFIGFIKGFAPQEKNQVERNSKNVIYIRYLHHAGILRLYLRSVIKLLLNYKNTGL